MRWRKKDDGGRSPREKVVARRSAGDEKDALMGGLLGVAVITMVCVDVY